ncbi:MAG: EF-hand domain-containing protein [Allosphingosinicella sp.]
MTRNLKILAGAAVLAATGAVSAIAQPGGGPFARLDANGDGKVTLEEFHAHAAEMFRHVDTDGDGRATLADFQAAHEKMRAEHGGMMHHGARGGHDGGHDAGHDGGPPPPGRPHGPPPPEQMDADHDGIVTLAEFTAGLEAHFAAADSNHDGAVTREEMEAAHQAMRPPRP